VITERDALCLEYHSKPDRNSSCGSLADDMASIFAGHLDFAPDGRLLLTAKGKVALADYRPAPPASAAKGVE
jgi:hypothetical protein